MGKKFHLMIVEISPTDVVSVPLDCDCQKLRTSKYKVVSHFEKKLENTLRDDYGDYDYDDDDDDTESRAGIRIYDSGYDAGYNEAKKQFGIGVSQN